jgi:hypothetical protein
MVSLPLPDSHESGYVANVARFVRNEIPVNGSRGVDREGEVE